MQLTKLSNVPIGAKLAQPVYGNVGQPLLNAGVELNAQYLDMLRGRGMDSIYIEDPDTADIELPQPLSPELRAKVTAHLGKAFTDISAKSDDLRAAYVAVARKEMQASRFADAIKSSIGGEGLYTVARDMDSMLDELKGQQVLTGLNSIKAHDSYTFQHCIDVTIMGLVLARSLNWERWRLRQFGVGCMLHDLGKLFIDPGVLNKNGKLSDDEFKQIKAHPAVGYDLIKSLAADVGVLAPHVAYQHHERQDGTGYPRGLRGTNTLGGNDKGVIHDFGAVAAAADVYDAMTSNRPYRSGWTPARTLAMIQANAGTHFNQQAVSLMLAAVPPYPVYSDVRVTTGKYTGWRGIVSDVSRVDLNRPTVRLLFHDRGERTSPVEINLRKDPDVGIEAVSQPLAMAA